MMDREYKVKEKCSQLIKKHYLDKGIIFKNKMIENEIFSNISSDSSVLDAGCGYDAALISKYSTFIKEAVGVDLIEKFQAKRGVKTYTANLESLPFCDNYFDVIISRDVCEHLANPLKVFGELKRVLKPNGKIIMVTPNKYCYSSIISKLLPTSFKKNYLKKVFGKDAYENFFTFYRCNTKKAITKIAKGNRLAFDKFACIRHYPYYLMFSVILFKLGILFDRLISGLGLSFLQDNFLFILINKEE